MLISDLSIANIKYITRKELPLDKFYELIQAFRPVFAIVPLGAEVVDRALNLYLETSKTTINNEKHIEISLCISTAFGF